MSSLKNTLRRFVREEEGASLAEYALLLGVITPSRSAYSASEAPSSSATKRRSV
jgi:hypothetical protein